MTAPNQTPQSTFDEKVTDTLIDFVFEVYGSILPTNHPELVKSVAAITSLVLEEVVNHTKEIYYTKGLPNLLRTEDYIKGREDLREEQRSIITKEGSK